MQCTCVILSSVFWGGYYFSLHPIYHCKMMMDISRKRIKMCVLIFSTLSFEIFLILRSEQDMIKNVHHSSCKVLVILVRL